MRIKVGYWAAVILIMLASYVVGAESSPTERKQDAQPASKSAMGEPEAQGILSKMKDTYRDMKSLGASGQVLTTSVMTDPNTAAKTTTEMRTDFTVKMMKPDLYLVEWSMRAKDLPEMPPSAVFNDGTGNYLVMSGNKMPQKNRMMALASATGISSGAASTLPAMFFCEQWGGIAGVNLAKMPDEKMGGEDCFVLVDKLTSSGTETKVWIAKKTFLIRRCQTTIAGAPGGVAQELTDEQIREVMKETGQDASDEKVAQFKETLKQDNAMMGDMKVTMVQTFTDLKVNPVLGKNEFVPKKALKR